MERLSYNLRPPRAVKDLLPPGVKGRYRGYAKNTGTIAGSGTATVVITFNAPSVCYAWSGTATQTTAAIGGRDSFKANLNRQTQDTIVTEQAIGTVLFGVYDAFAVFAEPFPVARGEAIEIPVTNLSGSSNTVYFLLHCVEPC